VGHRDHQHPHQRHHPQPVAAGHPGSSGQGETAGRIQNPQRNRRGLVGQAHASNCRHPERQGGDADPLPGGDPEYGGEWQRQGGFLGGGELISALIVLSIIINL